mmetsp:Transcript_43687/g.135601  ORF Transcript_43687/g.135601 Transcript_43687/m.135601 type:complete len:335 (-) Transcript_43687:25-1029(-)
MKSSGDARKRSNWTAHSCRMVCPTKRWKDPDALKIRVSSAQNCTKQLSWETSPSAWSCAPPTLDSSEVRLPMTSASMAPARTPTGATEISLPAPASRSRSPISLMPQTKLGLPPTPLNIASRSCTRTSVPYASVRPRNAASPASRPPATQLSTLASKSLRSASVPMTPRKSVPCMPPGVGARCSIKSNRGALSLRRKSEASRAVPSQRASRMRDTPESCSAELCALSDSVISQAMNRWMSRRQARTTHRIRSSSERKTLKNTGTCSCLRIWTWPFSSGEPLVPASREFITADRRPGWTVRWQVLSKRKPWRAVPRRCSLPSGTLCRNSAHRASE